jgi:hypothetical protein
MSSEEGDPATPRGADRVSVSAEVGLRRAGVKPFRVQVFDVSETGCKIEFVELPTLGERVWVKFDNLEALEGSVRWIENHVGGVEFERPFYKPVFDRLFKPSS